MRVFEALFGTHRWFDRNVDAFADGELREGERARFEQHLQSCERCQASVSRARGMKSLIAALPEMPVTRSFAITESMLHRPALPQPRKRDLTAPLRAVQGLGAGAVALFAVLVVVDVGGGGSGSLATPSGDFDAAAPVGEATQGSPDELRPAGDDDSDGGAAGGLEDGGDGADPGTTPGSVEGAGVDDPAPLPTPAPDVADGDEPPAGQGEPADRSTDESDPGEFETTALVADDGDDGGVDWLRVSQVASLAGAALAAVTYLALRRRVAADR